MSVEMQRGDLARETVELMHKEDLEKLEEMRDQVSGKLFELNGKIREIESRAQKFNLGVTGPTIERLTDRANALEGRLNELKSNWIDSQRESLEKDYSMFLENLHLVEANLEDMNFQLDKEEGHGVGL